MKEKNILYIGGFQLPDKNAAALRVMSNAKALRSCGYTVVFFNAVNAGEKKCKKSIYEGFQCLNYSYKSKFEYLLRCNKIISIIEKWDIDYIIAYNYPAIALDLLRRYCIKNNKVCIADATEWYQPKGNIIFRLIKKLDTEYRMRYVQKKLDGVIAISDLLYRYYVPYTHCIKVPPLVDLEEKKWKITVNNSKSKYINLIYAGNPSTTKERLDVIVQEVEQVSDTTLLHLDIVGITQTQFEKMYNCTYSGRRITFWGRIPNSEVIKLTKQSDWTIVLREKNKVVQAGFPTKVAESISCGTPVIANSFSNISDYLNNDNSILLNDVNDFGKALKRIYKKNPIDNAIFDYKKYQQIFSKFFEYIGDDDGENKNFNGT